MPFFYSLNNWSHVITAFITRSALIYRHTDTYGRYFRTQFHIIKPTRCTNFSDLFWNKTLHISYSSSVRHQEYFTVHTAMVYIIPVCGQLSAKPVWRIPLLCVQWNTPDDGQRYCPKHVEFHSTIKLRN